MDLRARPTPRNTHRRKKAGRHAKVIGQKSDFTRANCLSSFSDDATLFCAGVGNETLAKEEKSRFDAPSILISNEEKSMLA